MIEITGIHICFLILFVLFLYGTWEFFLMLDLSYKKTQNSKDFAFTELDKMTNLILEFLVKADQIKYKKEIYIYIEVLNDFSTLLWHNDSVYIESLNKRRKLLFETFKGIIPELIQEERERKLKDLL